MARGEPGFLSQAQVELQLCYFVSYPEQITEPLGHLDPASLCPLQALWAAQGQICLQVSGPLPALGLVQCRSEQAPCSA